MKTELLEYAASQSSPYQHHLKQHSLRLRSFIPYFFLLPAALLFLLFFVVPLVYAVWQSLFRLQRVGLGLSLPTRVFVGLTNYQQVLRDPVFYQGIERVLLYGLIQVPIMLGLAILLALLLDSAARRVRAFFQITFFLPYAIPGIVAVLLWSYFYDPRLSPITQVLSVLHLGTPNFLGAKTIIWSIGNIGVWLYTGYYVLITFAALQAIPPGIYEAARMDGCSEWRIAHLIKIPMILPTLVLIGLFAVIGALQLFTDPMVMQSISSNITSGYTPNMYLYKVALADGNYFYAAALSVTLALFTAVFSFSVLGLAHRKAGV